MFCRCATQLLKIYVLINLPLITLFTINHLVQRLSHSQLNIKSSRDSPGRKMWLKCLAIVHQSNMVRCSSHTLETGQSNNIGCFKHPMSKGILWQLTVLIYVCFPKEWTGITALAIPDPLLLWARKPVYCYIYDWLMALASDENASNQNSEPFVRLSLVLSTY